MLRQQPAVRPAGSPQRAPQPASLHSSASSWQSLPAGSPRKVVDGSPEREAARQLLGLGSGRSPASNESSPNRAPPIPLELPRPVLQIWGGGMSTARPKSRPTSPEKRGGRAGTRPAVPTVWRSVSPSTRPLAVQAMRSVAGMQPDLFARAFAQSVLCSYQACAVPSMCTCGVFRPSGMRHRFDSQDSGVSVLFAGLCRRFRGGAAEQARPRSGR